MQNMPNNETSISTSLKNVRVVKSLVSNFGPIPYLSSTFSIYPITLINSLIIDAVYPWEHSGYGQLLNCVRIPLKTQTNTLVRRASYCY